MGQWHVWVKFKIRKLLRNPAKPEECGVLSHLMSVFLPLDFAGFDNRPAHTQRYQKGQFYGVPEEAEGQMTHRSCFTRDQWLDPDGVLKSQDCLSGVRDG